MPHLELISFRLCPFVQRAMILMRYKAIGHEVAFVDLGDPPDWFRELSPSGRVPLLRVDGQVSIFESAVISEYLDEISPPSLMPRDPLARAVNRGWIDYATTTLMPLRELTTVDSASALVASIDGFQRKLVPLEQALGAGPFFNGDAFSLVDAAYAPLFVRLDYFDATLDDLTPSVRFPKLAVWRAALSGLPAVQNTVGEDFADRMDELVAKRQGYLATLLPQHLKTSGPRRDY
ncbi:MAG: glutathione S-transferase family protein [Pseudomonadota bacterium]